MKFRRKRPEDNLKPELMPLIDITLLLLVY
jgi:biopolymer transport protein ExbD